MSTELVHQTFDYDLVDYDTKAKLICLAGDINRSKNGHIKTALGMGEGLKSAQDLLSNHGNGTFGRWVQAECGIARSTAHNYMQAWKLYKDCPCLEQFDAESMYILSAPNSPKEASKKAEKLAKTGVKITIDRARKILDEFREKAPVSRPKAEHATGPTLSVVQQETEPAAETLPAEALPKPAPPRQWGDGDSLEEVQADLKEFKRRCGELNKFVRTILRCEGSEIMRPYCGEYSLLTLSQPLTHVARCVMNDLPVGGTPNRPLLYHEEKAQ